MAELGALLPPGVPASPAATASPSGVPATREGPAFEQVLRGTVTQPDMDQREGAELSAAALAMLSPVPLPTLALLVQPAPGAAAQSATIGPRPREQLAPSSWLTFETPATGLAPGPSSLEGLPAAPGLGGSTLLGSPQARALPAAAQDIANDPEWLASAIRAVDAGMAAVSESALPGTPAVAIRASVQASAVPDVDAAPPEPHAEATAVLDGGGAAPLVGAEGGQRAEPSAGDTAQPEGVAAKVDLAARSAKEPRAPWPPVRDWSMTPEELSAMGQASDALRPVPRAPAPLVDGAGGTEPDQERAPLSGPPQPELSAYAARVYDAAMAMRAGEPSSRPVMPAAAPAQGQPARTDALLAARAARLAEPASAPVAVRSVDQVAGELAVAVRDGRTEAVITLRPEALGEVRAQISAGPEGLVIHLSAEHEAVGELLRAQLGELRAALAGHRVQVADVHVLHNNPPHLPAGSDPSSWHGQEEPRAQDRDDASEERPGRQAEQDDEE